MQQLSVNHSFLCGYFSAGAGGENQLPSGWIPEECSEESFASYKQYFDPGFAEFMLSAGNSAKVRRYSMEIGRTVNVAGVNVSIRRLKLFMMPFGIRIYAIQADMESDSLNDFTLALFRMREQRYWSDPAMKDFADAAVEPLRAVASALGCDSCDLVENGNKLKVFQIVTSEAPIAFGRNDLNTLFELGTLGKIGGCSEKSPDSPSESYVERILSTNRLSFYNNWQALALFDTFTMWGYNLKPWMLQAWQDDYFSLIYIHSLFCKFYLYRLNERFHLNPGEGEELEQEYKEFDRQCTFHRISFNFLPIEIDRAIDRALEISEEKKQLRYYISEYSKQIADESASRLNKLLTFLTVVTVLSTVWDFSCMVNAVMPYSSVVGTEQSGYRLVVSLSILALLIVILATLRRPRRR